MNERTLVTRAELQEILNEKLGEFEECDGCTLRQQVPLQEPREDGCNWSTDVQVRCVGGRGSATACAKVAARIVAEAARDYNLKHWPEGTQVRAVEQDG